MPSPAIPALKKGVCTIAFTVLKAPYEWPPSPRRVRSMSPWRTMDFTHPMMLPGIKYNFNGNADAFAVEGSEIAKYDSAKQQWMQLRISRRSSCGTA